MRHTQPAFQEEENPKVAEMREAMRLRLREVDEREAECKAEAAKAAKSFLETHAKVRAVGRVGPALASEGCGLQWCLAPHHASPPLPHCVPQSREEATQRRKKNNREEESLSGGQEPSGATYWERIVEYIDFSAPTKGDTHPPPFPPPPPSPPFRTHTPLSPSPFGEDPT